MMYYFVLWLHYPKTINLISLVFLLTLVYGISPWRSVYGSYCLPSTHILTSLLDQFSLYYLEQYSSVTHISILAELWACVRNNIYYWTSTLGFHLPSQNQQKLWNSTSYNSLPIGMRNAFLPTRRKCYNQKAYPEICRVNDKSKYDGQWKICLKI